MKHKKLTELDKIRIQARDDLSMMQDPNFWPKWPLLPVKRYKKNGDQPETGLLFADNKPVIYSVGLYQLGDRPGTTYGEKFAGVKTFVYADFPALLADGWEVD